MQFSFYFIDIVWRSLKITAPVQFFQVFGFLFTLPESCQTLRTQRHLLNSRLKAVETKAILLVSKADVWMDVLLPGVVGGSATVVEVNADAAEPGFEPPVQKGISAEGKLSIGPYAVAVTTTLQLAS